MESPTSITVLLRRLSAGNGEVPDAALIAVYEELRRIAASEMRWQGPDHTLQVTALVNEAVLRVLGSGAREWADRKHFFTFAACVMRRILVDHARRRGRRGKSREGVRVALDDVVEPLESRAGDLEALDRALTKLAEFNETGARLVELRFFLGLPMAAAADALGISKRAAEREWTSSRAWLHKELERDS